MAAGGIHPAHERHAPYPGASVPGRYKAKIIDPENPEYFLRVSEYIHLNPAAAGLRSPTELSGYAWSSYPLYLLPPGRRPEWMDAGAVLGEYRLGDSASGRRQYAEHMELRARRAAARPLEHGKDYTGMERGWVHGGRDFRLRMATLVQERLAGPVRIYDAGQKRDLTEEAAGRFLDWACARLNLDRSRLGELRKGDERKVLLAACIKARYTLANGRIAELLQMGHPTIVSACRGRVEASRKLSGQCKTLLDWIDHEKD